MHTVSTPLELRPETLMLIDPSEDVRSGHRCMATGPGFHTDTKGLWGRRARAGGATSRSDPVLCFSSQLCDACVRVCVRGKCLRELLSHVDETFAIRFQLKVVESKDAVLFSRLSERRWFPWDVFP